MRAGIDAEGVLEVRGDNALVDAVDALAGVCQRGLVAGG